MRALHRGDSLLSGAIEADRVQLPLQRRRLGRREVKGLPFRVAALDASDAPVTAGHLVDQLPRVVVTIEMLEPVPVGEPEELAGVRRERHHVVYTRVEIVDIEPGLRRFRHHLSAAARFDVEEKQLHLVLRAIQSDNSDRVRSAGPVNPRDVELPTLTYIEPGILAAGDVDD